MNNEIIVFTNGVFDLLHYGHIKFLEACSLLGDILVVGINSDTSVKKLKGKYRPFISEKYRREMLEALEFVDEVIIFDGDNPVHIIEQLQPDIYVKSSEYKGVYLPEFLAVQAYGGTVVIIDPSDEMKQFSTTKIADLIFRREFERRVGLNVDSRGYDY